jgi:ribosomal protein S18 acetylase RimI-like enzyme
VGGLDWRLDTATHEVDRFVEDRLYEFNRAATGHDDGRGLALVARDPAGEIVAAASGHTWGGTCEILRVWVREPLRRSGLGRELLERVEAEARRRGCGQIVVATHSFQAPDFYAKLGYERIGEIPDYPRGHSEIQLRKRLDAGGTG